jgi:hypothetical protein
MPRTSSFGLNEVSFVKRIRAPKDIIAKLMRMTPAQRGAWICHADQLVSKHAPEFALEQPPKPIPESAYKKKRQRSSATSNS